MPALADIISWLDETLDVARVRDVAENGLQVEGAAQVDRVVTGVSANLALLQEAAARDAQLVIAHHGLVWGGIRRVTGPLRGRLALLLGHNMSLAAYHLPLDLHEPFGNNAGLSRVLGLSDVEPFGTYKGQIIGRQGRLASPVPLSTFVEQVRGEVQEHVQVLPGGDHLVEKVAVCSGGGADLVEEAMAAGCDLFLSGETAEYSPALAAEGRIHVLAAGHHATERFGVRVLAEEIGQRFGCSSEFVDIPNTL